MPVQVLIAQHHSSLIDCDDFSHLSLVFFALTYCSNFMYVFFTLYFTQCTTFFLVSLYSTYHLFPVTLYSLLITHYSLLVTLYPSLIICLFF